MERVTIAILGLVILIAAVIAGAAGVLGNGGSGHALTRGFAILGHHVTGSTGTLFLYGMVIGALALAGLSLVLAGARRTSRSGRAARRMQPTAGQPAPDATTAGTPAPYVLAGASAPAE